MSIKRLESREKWIVLAIGCLLVLLSSVPYIFGYLNKPADGDFLWMTFNIDDFCVYQSWTRQVADGHFLMKNLFTSESQPSMQFNLFFAAAGMACRVTGLAPVTILHIFRILLIIALIWAVWRLSSLFLDDARARIIACALLAFSSGFGWMFPDSRIRDYLPVDRWQPESLVFLSAYLNPLFLAALVLLAGGMYFLVRLHRTGRMKYAAAAGVCMLLLGNVHTYDLVPLGIGWGIYVAVLFIKRRPQALRTLALSVVAAVMALPSVAYQYHVFNSDPVFRARANTPAESPVIWAYFLGFGLVFILALTGTWLTLKRKGDFLPVTWALAGFIAPYLPFAQQRKFIMGVQIPLVILAVTAIVWVLRRRNWRDWAAITVLVVAVSFATNIVFMQRDIQWLARNHTAPRQRPYLAFCESRAMDWLRDNVKPGESILCAPDPAVLIPVLAGREVYAGHWSETPDYPEKMSEWMVFINPGTSDEWRRGWLTDRGITYVWYNDYRKDPNIAKAKMVPSLEGRAFLKPVFRDYPVVLYKVVD